MMKSILWHSTITMKPTSKLGKPVTCQVVVNHTIVLTDEEKAEARQKAIQKVQD